MQFPQLSRSGYFPGALAGLISVAIMLVLGRAWGAPVPPQMLSDRLTAVIPLEIFAAMLGQLESSAKPLTFALLIGGQILAGGLIGAYLYPLVRRGDDPLRIVFMVTGGLWLLLSLVIAPLGGIGVFGVDSSAGFWTTSGAFFLTALGFSFVLMLWLASVAGQVGGEFSPGRRRAVTLAVIGIPGLLATAYLGRFFTGLASRSQVAAPASGGELAPALTPFQDFYVVSKNFIDPNVSLSDWELPVGGEVRTPKTYHYDELLAMPPVKQISTLECISNLVGGEFISNGEWTGVRLVDILDEVGVLPEAIDVVLRAADDYTDSIPVEAARDPRTLLAYELNGIQLDRDHGFPLRLIVPGIYGMKNVKWITGINLAAHDHQGYWQVRGWSDVALVEPMSRIDLPRDNSRLNVGQETTIGGVAFTGERGVSRVEVSTDGGDTWHETDVEPPLSPLSWVRWLYQWRPERAGTTELVVRCWDADGELQVEEDRSPLPDGSTGYHRIGVRVSGDEAHSSKQPLLALPAGQPGNGKIRAGRTARLRNR